MNVGDTLQAISQAGLTVTTAEGALKVHPAEKITPELATDIKANKVGIIKILHEDEEMERTGVIQSERQVFELAREYFGLEQNGEPK